MQNPQSLLCLVSSRIEIPEMQVEAVLEEMWRMMEPSYKENYFRFVISIPMLFDLVESFRRAEESLELEVGYNRVGDEVVAGRSLGLEEERCDVEVMQGKDINEPDKVKQELEDVMEVEVADPLGMDLEESPQFSNNANNEKGPATLAETIIDSKAEHPVILERTKDPATLFTQGQVPPKSRSSNLLEEKEPRPEMPKSQTMGQRQVVISLEQSEAGREVLLDEEKEVVEEDKRGGLIGRAGETVVTKPPEKEKEYGEKESGEIVIQEPLGEELNKLPAVKRTHRFHKMKTKEISKYRVSTALEKSISKKHSLSLSLRKAVLEKLEKQKELLALRAAAEKKKKSESRNLVDVQEVGSITKDGSSIQGSNENPNRKDEQNVSKTHTVNQQSDLVEVIDKTSEAQSDLKSLIKTLVTKKTPDSETIKKIVSKTRLDLKNREEAKEIEKKKVDMANWEEKSNSKEVEVKKCRYCKDNNGWGEVIVIMIQIK